MGLYTKEYLRGVASRETRFFSEQTVINESISEAEQFDIFLSHSFIDKEDVKGLYIELRRMGYSVYVDWIVDPQLDRNNVTEATARLVRKRLLSSKSLLLAISMNSATSKWVPWELGVVDGNTKQCALVPVSESAVAPTSFKGTEYLSIYPYIKKQRNKEDIDKLWVVERPDKYVDLEHWVNEGMQPFLKDIQI